RQSRLAPRLEASDHVAGPGVTQLLEHRSGEDRGVALVAEDDHAPLDVAQVRVPRPAAGLEAPFEHGARDVKRAWDDALALPRAIRADVHDQSARGSSRMGVCGLEALDPRAGVVEELAEGHLERECQPLRTTSQLSAGARRR